MHPTSHKPTPTSPRVILMCAPPGSGKSTYAHHLASSGYTRLSIDDTAWAQGHRVQPLPDDVGDAIVAELDARLLSLVRGGRDVVLDYSFWARAIRDKYRRLLAEEGVVPTIVYVRTPREVGVERMRRRRGKHGDDFWLDDETVGRYWDAFEAPTDDEGEVVVVSGDG